MLLRARVSLGKSEKHFERNAITNVEWIGLIQFQLVYWLLRLVSVSTDDGCRWHGSLNCRLLAGWLAGWIAKLNVSDSQHSKMASAEVEKNIIKPIEFLVDCLTC